MNQKLANGIAGFIGAGLTFLARVYLSNQEEKDSGLNICLGLGASALSGVAAAAATPKPIKGEDPTEISALGLAASALLGAGVGFVSGEVSNHLAPKKALENNPGFVDAINGLTIDQSTTPGGKIYSEITLDNGDVVKVVYNPDTGKTTTTVTSDGEVIKVTSKEGHPDNETDTKEEVLTSFSLMKSQHKPKRFEKICTTESLSMAEQFSKLMHTDKHTA